MILCHARTAEAPHIDGRIDRRRNGPLTDHSLYIDKPVVIDAELRIKLEDFKDRDPKKSWAWYVQGTGTVTEHDFGILTKAKKTKAQGLILPAPFTLLSR